MYIASDIVLTLTTFAVRTLNGMPSDQARLLVNNADIPQIPKQIKKYIFNTYVDSIHTLNHHTIAKNLFTCSQLRLSYKAI